MSLERLSCPSCGANDFRHDAEGSLICGSCGTKFESPREPLTCPVCNTQNPPQAIKCMNCGQTLGRACPACNYPNPSGVDHCLQCATPLDTLSSVFMRTGEGRRHSAALIKKELVKTKGQDLVYMAEQRARLDAGETERLRSLRGQQRRARQQQRAILAITLVGLVLLAAAVIVVVTLFR